MSEITRKTIIADKKEITDEEINQLIELKHEYPDMTGLKKYTDKKYRDLSEEEKKELVENLLTDDYLKYKNCFIARSKLLYDTSETLEKEVSILDKMNDLGYEIYLLPYQYARDSMNCYQKSADSISMDNFLEFKTVTSTGKNAGQSAFRDGKKQANNIYITLKNEISEEKVINNIYATIREAKNNKNEVDYSGLLYLNFEKLDNKTVLYELDKDGYAVRLQSADFDYLKKIKGIVSDSQVLENPITEHGSSPKTNINEQNISVNSVNKTISGNLKFENADPENSWTDEDSFVVQLFEINNNYELEKLLDPDFDVENDSISFHFRRTLGKEDSVDWENNVSDSHNSGFIDFSDASNDLTKEIHEKCVEAANDFCQKKYNMTLDSVMKKIRNEQVVELWNELEDIPFDTDESGIPVLSEDWKFKFENKDVIFSKGTEQITIWNWFNERYSKGISYLLYGETEKEHIYLFPKEFVKNTLDYSDNNLSYLGTYNFPDSGECQVVSGRLDKLNEFAESSGYELHPDFIYEKEELVLSHAQSIDVNKDLFNKEEFLTGMLSNILAVVDEDKIFNEYYTKKDFIETYIKNEENKVETVEDLAGELLAYSVLRAGLNIYDDTWNYLLKITDNIYPAVYVASQDAFLGDSLRFFIDNADGTQWDKLQENRFYADGVLKNALESIMNDTTFTVDPTLELAEKLHKLPEALEYLNKIKEEYSKGYKDWTQYQEMVDSIQEYTQKYMKEKFVRLTPAGFKGWIEENEHLKISKEQSLALLKSLDGNYREVGLINNKLIYWQSEPATDEYHPTTLEELCNMQLEVEMNMYHDNMDNYLSEITEIAKENNFKSITDKIEENNWLEAITVWNNEKKGTNADFMPIGKLKEVNPDDEKQIHTVANKLSPYSSYTEVDNAAKAILSMVNFDSASFEFMLDSENGNFVEIDRKNKKIIDVETPESIINYLDTEIQLRLKYRGFSDKEIKEAEDIKTFVDEFVKKPYFVEYYREGGFEGRTKSFATIEEAVKHIDDRNDLDFDFWKVTDLNDKTWASETNNGIEIVKPDGTTYIYDSNKEKTSSIVIEDAEWGDVLVVKHGQYNGKSGWYYGLFNQHMDISNVEDNLAFYTDEHIQNNFKELKKTEDITVLDIARQILIDHQDFGWQRTDSEKDYSKQWLEQTGTELSSKDQQEYLNKLDELLNEKFIEKTKPSLEPLDYPRYVNKHLSSLVTQMNTEQIAKLKSYNEQAGDKMLYDKEHDKLYRLNEYDIPNYEKTHNTDLLNESDLLEMLSFSASEAEDGNIGRTEDDPMIKVNNEACNFFKEKVGEINVAKIANSFINSLTDSRKDEFYSPDEQHECRFYCDFDPTVLGFTDSLESEDTTYRVGMVFNKGQESVDFFIDRINNSSTIDYDVQVELGGNYKDAFSLAEDHVRRWFIEKNPEVFPIVVDYAFPEKQHGITSYEEPRWSFTDKNLILEVIKNNSPDVYDELMGIMKEYPDETFNFDLGKSLVYSDNWIVGNGTKDFSKETLEERLDDIYQFRYWNNYDDNHKDINDFDEPIELILKDKELVSKLNEMIKSHVQENIESWNVYKEKRIDNVINELRSEQLHINDKGEEGLLRLQTFTLSTDLEEALDLNDHSYSIDGNRIVPNFWLEADYEIKDGNVKFTYKELPVIKVHEYIDINQHEEEKSVHELSYYVSEDLQKKIAYEFDAKMVEETILPDLGLTRQDFIQFENLFKDTITSEADYDGNLWRVFSQVHREWGNDRTPEWKIENTISRMLYDSIENNLYKTYELGEDDGRILRCECCDEIASHIVSGEIKDWETIQTKAELFCKDWVMKNELKNDISVNTIFGHSVPETNEIGAEIKKHTFIYKMNNEIVKSLGLELESSENPNIKYSYEIRGTYSGQYNSDKLRFDNPEFDFVSLATDFSEDKEFGNPLDDKTAIYPLDDYKSTFGEQTITTIKDSFSEKAAELTSSLRIFRLSKGEEVHFNTEELEPAQVEDIQLFFAKETKNKKHPSTECVNEIIRMTDEDDAGLYVDPAGRICMNVDDGIEPFNSADELGETILKFFDNQIENGNLEPFELMEETQFSDELQQLVNEIQTENEEKRKTELGYSNISSKEIADYVKKEFGINSISEKIINILSSELDTAYKKEIVKGSDGKLYSHDMEYSEELGEDAEEYSVLDKLRFESYIDEAKDSIYERNRNKDVLNEDDIAFNLENIDSLNSVLLQLHGYSDNEKVYLKEMHDICADIGSSIDATIKAEDLHKLGLSKDVIGYDDSEYHIHFAKAGDGFPEDTLAIQKLEGNNYGVTSSYIENIISPELFYKYMVENLRYRGGMWRDINSGYWDIFTSSTKSGLKHDGDTYKPIIVENGKRYELIEPEYLSSYIKFQTKLNISEPLAKEAVYLFDANRLPLVKDDDGNVYQYDQLNLSEEEIHKLTPDGIVNQIHNWVGDELNRKADTTMTHDQQLMFEKYKGYYSETAALEKVMPKPLMFDWSNFSEDKFNELKAIYESGNISDKNFVAQINIGNLFVEVSHWEGEGKDSYLNYSFDILGEKDNFEREHNGIPYSRYGERILDFGLAPFLLHNSYNDFKETFERILSENILNAKDNILFKESQRDYVNWDDPEAARELYQLKTIDKLSWDDFRTQTDETTIYQSEPLYQTAEDDIENIEKGVALITGYNLKGNKFWNEHKNTESNVSVSLVERVTKDETGAINPRHEITIETPTDQPCFEIKYSKALEQLLEEKLPYKNEYTLDYDFKGFSKEDFNRLQNDISKNDLDDGEPYGQIKAGKVHIEIVPHYTSDNATIIVLNCYYPDKTSDYGTTEKGLHYNLDESCYMNNEKIIEIPSMNYHQFQTFLTDYIKEKLPKELLELSYGKAVDWDELAVNNTEKDRKDIVNALENIVAENENKPVEQIFKEEFLSRFNKGERTPYKMHKMTLEIIKNWQETEPVKGNALIDYFVDYKKKNNLKEEDVFNHFFEKELKLIPPKKIQELNNKKQIKSNDKDAPEIDR